MTTDTGAGTHAQTIKRYFDAIVAGDSATLLEILTPDAVTRWPQSRERSQGTASTTGSRIASDKCHRWRSAPTYLAFYVVVSLR